MNNKENLEIINEIDILLSRASVSGDSVFLICDSRRLLKQIYDNLCNQSLNIPTAKEGVEHGG